jgi:hypothetical protein
MPFQSEAQRRYLWANEPEIARDWTDTYGSRIQKNTGGISQLVKPGPGRPGYRGDHAYSANVSKGPTRSAPDERPDRGPDPRETYISTRAIPQLSTAAQAGSLSDPREKQDHIEKKWTGQPGILGIGGGYKNVPPDRTGGIGGLKKMISQAMSFIPGLGMLRQMTPGINQWQKNLRKKYLGYETQDEWEKARRARQLQSRFDKLMDRKLSGKNYSQKNLDMLSAMGINPSKDSLAAALARDANQPMNMSDGPLATSYLQSIAQGFPPAGPTGMYNMDDMLMNKPMGPYSEQPGPWNNFLRASPMQRPIFDPSQGNVFQSVDPSQPQFGGGITHTPQAQGFWGNIWDNIKSTPWPTAR